MAACATIGGEPPYPSSTHVCKCAAVAARGRLRRQGTPALRRRLGRRATPCGPSDGPALTRLSSGGSGQTVEATTLLLGQRPHSRALPQRGSLEAPAADKLRVVHETGRGISAGYQPCRGERTGQVRPVPLHPRPQGPGVPPRKGYRVGVGGHALLVAARAFGIRFPL